MHLFQRTGLFGLFHIRFRTQNHVDSFERSHALSYGIGSLTEVLGGIDDAIENHEVIDEYRRIDSRGFTQNKATSKPEQHRYQSRSQKLRYRMS